MRNSSGAASSQSEGVVKSNFDVPPERRKIDSSSPALLRLFLAAEPNGRTSAHLPLGHFRIFLSHHSCFQQQPKLNCFAPISFPQLTPNDGAVLIAITRLLAGFGQIKLFISVK